MTQAAETTGLEIAVIGMNGRFPQANTLDQFWQNLCNGTESITRFSKEDLLDAGVDPALIEHPDYVPAAAVLDHIDQFDAAFFGYNPHEAAIIDPQQRLFLEVAWAALEDAGINPDTTDSLIGVYGGVGLSNYLLNVYSHPELSQFLILLGNDKDFITTRVSYKLNLKGPSVNVQSACSTSLVAIHLACQGLLAGECDIALAGGAAIKVPHQAGYLYQEGGILSPDGHCRAFDASAKGTVPGNGAGVVVLKRLEDALEDGDHIEAIIKGTAINNDGSLKVGFTAPSIDGQTAVIQAAQLIAEVEADTIQYVETHGTGTPLGDPIEIAALSKAFQANGDQPNESIAIGSLKSNLGHLDTAAGVAGFIKTVLALKNRTIPPSLHFEKPNPQTELTNSPFYVNNKLTNWQNGSGPRRAAISSFGLGGTNAHAILEEAPNSEASFATRPFHPLPLSARSNTALDQMTANLADHLEQHPDLPLADVAYTLQTGRKGFHHRRLITCRSRDEAITALRQRHPDFVMESTLTMTERPLTFLFSGQGAQYINMGHSLYEQEPVFHEAVDECAAILQPHLGFDVRDVLYPLPADAEKMTARLQETAVTQPALFTIEYALAQLWMSWGIQPTSMIGHSIGEYAAACLAGVFSLKDALLLVALRGQLMQHCQPGSMLSIPRAAAQIAPLLPENVTIAAINAPNLCAVSGPEWAINAFANQLAAQGIDSHHLHTSHAFHSAMMDPILHTFTKRVAGFTLNPPSIPFVSNVTGTWITDEQATDPAYWATHLRQPVQFADGMTTILAEQGAILLEVGPGRTLTSLARQHNAFTSDHISTTSLRHPKEETPDALFLLKSIGHLWLAGSELDWQAYYANEQRRRVSLPTYPFERQSYWLDAQSTQSRSHTMLPSDGTPIPTLYTNAWERTLQPNTPDTTPKKWLILSDILGIGEQLAQRLAADGHSVTRHAATSNIATLLPTLAQENNLPDAIINLWGLDATNSLHALLDLARAIDQHKITQPMQLVHITSISADVSGRDVVDPLKTAVFGTLKVISQEYPHLSHRIIDIAPANSLRETARLVDQLVHELQIDTTGTTVALRGRQRWQQTVTQLKPDTSSKTDYLREGGVFVIVDGLDGLGWMQAETLANAGGKLIFIETDNFPAQAEWTTWLATNSAQNSTSRKIRNVQSLATQPLILTADLTNLDQVEQTITHVIDTCGTINGLIFNPTISTTSTLADCDAIQINQLLDRHAAILANLNAALTGQTLDFCLVNSSLASILGGLQTAVSATTHTAIDAIVRDIHRTADILWRVINWDAWQTDHGPRTTDHGLTPENVSDLFHQALSHQHIDQLLISTTDLPSRIANWVTEIGEQETAVSDTTHQRPSLTTPYVAPRNEMEKQVADIWQTVMGIDQIGVYDNFFELGGHSLMATQMAARLREIFPIDLPLSQLFTAHTIADLMLLIAQEMAAEEDEDELATLLDELEESY